MSEIRVNTIANADGTAAPTMTYGFQVPTGMGITGAGGINISGVCTAGIITATNLYGTLNGNSTGLTGTPNISCGTIAGSTGTFSGAVNVDATTDSTSTTTGALIVDGGAAIAKNVYIGAGLSVAGTLTYEDVTSVDSVGMVTAKSGVNISGGQLQVGVAYSVGTAGVATALGFVAGTSGLSGTLQTASQTNVTAVGTLGNLTVSGDVFFDNGSDANKDLRWDVSADALHFNDSVYAIFGSDSDSNIVHDGSNFYLTNTTGTLNIRPKASEMAIACVPDGAVSLYYDNSVKLATTNDGVNITGMSTVTTGAHFQGMLREDCNIVANKLSAGTNIDLEDGMVHYYSTNETTTATPNIRWNSSYSLNNKMSTGESVTVTIISKPNGAGYYTHLTVDGSAVTEYWNGGNTPSSANSGGFDVTTYQITKTANATFLVLANVQNYS
jgi:hypothetical protein